MKLIIDIDTEMFIKPYSVPEYMFRKAVLNGTPLRAGHWTDKGSLSCRCSECGCKSNKETRFCANCGAIMEVNNEQHVL